MVLIGDIDEIPKRTSLDALLRSDDATANLLDSAVYALEGGTYYYHPQCKAVGGAFETWSPGPRLLTGASLLHHGGGTARYYSEAGSSRLPAIILPAASWHLRYFMPASAMISSLCTHSAPYEVVDATEWWNHDERANATALCTQPLIVHHAISHCADLWGRAAGGKGHPRQYAPTPAELAEMPHHVTHRPELYASSALNRLHEIKPPRRTR